MIRRIWPLFLLFGGCASLDNVIGGISNAPDWFQQRRVEIRGEGYPSFGDVPADALEKTTQANLQLSKEQILKAQELFARHPRAVPPVLRPEDIAEMASRLRRPIDKPLPPPDPVLTPEEVAALFASTRLDPVN